MSKTVSSVDSIRNIAMKKILLLALSLSLFSVAALADKTITMPDGTVCWINDVGVVYGCHGGPNGVSGTKIK